MLFNSKRGAAGFEVGPPPALSSKEPGVTSSRSSQTLGIDAVLRPGETRAILQNYSYEQHFVLSAGLGVLPARTIPHC